jgi:hypothetical protein
MKKVVLSLPLFLIIIMLTSCATRSVTYSNKVDESKYLSDSSNIKFQYFYRGFATIKENMIDTYPHGTLVIQTDENWHDFMDKFVPGIHYDISVDYSKEYLVVDVVFPAKSFYSIGADIKAFNINENRLEAEWIPSGIYAQNIDGAFHCFVNIVKVNKSDIPKNIENIYHRQ